MTPTVNVEGWTTAEIIERLLTLSRKMEAAGLYVNANTAWLAAERLRELDPARREGGNKP